MGFPHVLVVKNLPANAENAGDVSSIPGSGRSPGEENGNPFQYSCLGNPMDRGAWWAAAHMVAKSRTQLSMLHSCISPVLVTQLCPPLCDPMDCTLPGSSVPWIPQERILEWVAIPASRVSSQPRNRTPVSTVDRFLTDPAMISKVN